MQAPIFDSVYDTYRGAVTYVYAVNGELSHRERILMMFTRVGHDLLEVGVISPESRKPDAPGMGEAGYLITGIKDVRQSRVGDTVTGATRFVTQDLGGYQHPNLMVYAGLYPIDGDDFNELREALEKLQSNDAALIFELKISGAFGLGSRVGFLGLPRTEIVRGRLERELNLDLTSAAPDVVYRVVMEDDTEHTVTNPSECPAGKIAEVYEPVVRGTILTSSEYIDIMPELCQTRRGAWQGPDYLSEGRVEIRYTLPLAEIVFDFFDALKSRTKGYALLDYEPDGEQMADLVKVGILLHGDPVDAFSVVVHKDKAYSYGLRMAGKLEELIPRQQLEVPIQVVIGSRVIARETTRAMRKDMLVKCYGGDISRKRKLLEKQKESKKRTKMVGRVEVPQEAFVAASFTSGTTKKQDSGLMGHQTTNRDNWDSRADVHVGARGYVLDKATDPSWISHVVASDRSRFGEPRGLDGVHLQCHLGTDTISLVWFGARMTGLDLLPRSIEHTRRIAAENKVPVGYFVFDVCQVAEVLGSSRFDPVYIEIGALHWLLDIRRWAGTMRALLRPGGRFFVWDVRPVLNSLIAQKVGEDHPNRKQQPWIIGFGEIALSLELPYWEYVEPLLWRDGYSYAGSETVASPESVEQDYALSEIVVAVINAGLTLELLTEHDNVPWDALSEMMVADDQGEYRLAECPERLPVLFTLVARLV